MRGFPAAARPGVVPALAALVVFAILAFHPALLNDGDTYWHLAAGGWMLDHGRLLDRDVFSATVTGQPWIPLEWLSEVAMAGAYRLGGWTGVILLFAAAGAALVGLVGSRLSRVLPATGTAATLALLFLLAAPSLLARPHLLALPLLAGWTLALLRARDEDRAPPLWLPLLMVAWANLHGSYLFGLLLFGVFGLEALIAGRATPLKVIGAWAPAGLLTLAAAFATPHGLDGVLHPLALTRMRSLPMITEWRPVDFSTFGPVEAALLVTLLVCLLKGVRVPVVRLLLLLFVLHMTLEHQRHQAVLAVLGPLLLAEPLAEAYGRAGGRAVLGPRGLVAAALAFAVVAGVRIALPAQRPDGLNTPVTALTHLPPELAQRPVLNTYGFGGWLMLTGHRPFIDGRADMYGDAFMQRYDAITRGNQQALSQALERYGVDWTLLRPDEALVPILDVRPGWRRLYADRWAVLHVREAALATPWSLERDLIARPAPTSADRALGVQSRGQVNGIEPSPGCRRVAARCSVPRSSERDRA
ncbi:hypothetical protein [Phenylobacterium sp.]|uniref:hypothetical protein n=1 Tax=Phenylobacterium sp. TaxID=1871053 RepID=UPI00393806A6